MRLNAETLEKRWEDAAGNTATGAKLSVMSVPRKALPPLIPSAPDLEPDLLPEALGPWLRDIAERAQIPLAMVAAPAVVGLSGIIGRTLGIRPKIRDTWTVIPNLWGFGVGRPGTLKTHAMNEPMKPIKLLAAKARENHKQASYMDDAERDMIKAQIEAAQSDLKTAAKNAIQSDMDSNKARIANLKEQLDNCGSTQRRYMTSDPTIEKLGELLNENPRGLLLTRDELYGFMKGLDRDDRKGDREFYLEAWNGDGSLDTDRIGRGSIHVPALCLSIYGNIQPGKLQTYLRGALNGGTGDDGLLQRFQISVWPETSRVWKDVDRSPDIDALDKAERIFELLDVELPAMVPGADRPDAAPYLHFTPEAQELFTEWRGELEWRLRSEAMDGKPSFASHLAKYRSLMPSLALIFHLVETVPTGTLTPVSLQAAQLAATWCEFLEGHARKVYAPELNPDLAAAYSIQEKIKTGQIEDGLRLRDIYRKGWSGLSSPEQVHGGLFVLRQHGIAAVEQQTTGANPAEVIRVAS